MVNLYVKQIMANKITIDKVASLWKDKVIAAFQAKLDNGEITQEQFDQYTTERTDTEPTE